MITQVSSSENILINNFFFNSYDLYKRKVSKQNKYDIIHKIHNIKEYWIRVYNIIVSMIWE